MNTNIKSLSDSIIQTIRNEIAKTINKLPVAIPCKVVSREANRVNCISLINFGIPNQIINNIPISHSIYNNYPVKKDDIGFLIPLSYAFDDVFLGIENIEAIASNVLQNFIFLPLVKDLEEVAEIDNTIIKSQDLNNSITLSDTNIVIKTKDNKVEITLDTEGNVIINAEKEVKITAKENISVKSDKDISVECENATIKANSNADISCKEANIEAQSKATIKATEVVITGGTAKIAGSVAPTGSGAFCGIQACLFTGAPHVGDTSSGT